MEDTARNPQSLNILLIDDDLSIRFVVKKLLLGLWPAGINVFAAAEGVQGLGYAYIGKPDLVLVDTTLPLYSGREVIEFIVSNEVFAGSQIVVLHEGTTEIQAAQGLTVLDKRDPKFLDNLLSIVGDKLNLPSRSGRLKRSLPIYLGRHVISHANLSNSHSHLAELSKNWLASRRHKLAWLWQQFIASIYLAMFFGFAGKTLPEANIEQEYRDNRLFRVRAYPAIATILAGLILLISSWVTVATLSGVFLSTTTEKTRAAVTLTWDGGGGDNNWGTCANWTTDTCPTDVDDVVFDATSTKNSTVDSNLYIISSINSVTIGSGYTGTITMSRSLTVASTYTQSGGTFNLGSNSIDITGVFTLNSGGTFNSSSGGPTFSTTANINTGSTFTASSATTTFKGAVTINGSSTFNHNSGTIALNMDTNQTITCNSKTFNLVTITSANANTVLTVGATCSLPLGNNPTITRTTVSGTLSGTGTITSNGMLTIGATSTPLSGFSGMVNGSTLILNNASGTLNLSSYNPVTLAAFTQSAGTFTAPSGTMSISSTVTMSGGTFNHNSGVVNFTGGTANINCNGVTFNSVTFTGITNTKTIGATSTCSLPLGNNPTVPAGITLDKYATLTGTGTLTFSTATNSFTLRNGGSISGFSSLVLPNVYIGVTSAQTGNSATDWSSVSSVDIANALTLYTPTNGYSTSLKLPNTTVTIGSTFLVESSTTLDVNGGTLEFDGTASAPVFTCTGTISNLTLVTFTHTSGTKHISSNCSFPVGNNPTFGYGGSINTDGTFTGTGTITNTGSITIENQGSLSGFSGLVANNLMVGASSGQTANTTVSFASYNPLTVSGFFIVYSPTNPYTVSVTAPSGTMSISGAMTLNSGITFNANGGTLNFDGTTTATLTCNSATINLATFTHTAGVKTINSTCTMPLGASPTVGSGGDTTLSGTFSGTGTITTTGTFTITGGSATLTGFTAYSGVNAVIAKSINFATYTGFTLSGYLSHTANTLTLPSTGADINGAVTNSGGTLSLQNGTVNIAGDYTNSGGATVSYGSGTVNFDGTTSATVICNSLSFNIVTFTHTSGTKTISSDCSLSLGVSPTIGSGGDTVLHGVVSGTGTLSSTGTLTLGATASFSGFSAYSGNRLSSGVTINMSAYSSFTTSGDLLVTANTITLPTAGADINGSVRVSGGTLVAPTGNMTVTGAFDIFGSGVFTANGGTVTMDSGTDYTANGLGIYVFDTCSGSTVADFSGNANDATLVVGPSGSQSSAGTCVTSSTSWGNGAEGRYYASNYLDGTDDYLSITNNLVNPSSSDFSAASWVYFSSLPTTGNSMAVISQKSTPGTGREWLSVYNSGGTTYLNTYLSGSNNLGQTALATNTWYHLAITKSGSTVTIYLNGVSEGQFTISPTSATGGMNLGVNSAGTGSWLAGKLDEVRVYSVQLSLTQINNIYNLGRIATNCATSSGCANRFYNLTIDKTATTTTVVLSDNPLEVTNTFTLTKGLLLQYRNDVNFSGSTAVVIGTNGTYWNYSIGDIFLGGTLSNSGSISLFGGGSTCGQSDDIAISSTVSGTQRAWSGSGTFNINDVTVQDQGGSVNIQAKSSTSVSGNGSNWKFVGCTNSSPNVPTSASQTKNDNTQIVDAQWINQSTVKFVAMVSDVDNPDYLSLCIEKKPFGTAFTNTEDGCTSESVYSGTALTMTYTDTGISNNDYHWQARVKDTGGLYSAWRYFGDLEAGPVAWWRFEEGSGNTSSDFSGNGHTVNAEASSPTWTTGKFGNGIQTTSRGFYAPDAADLDNTSNITISAWFYPTTLGAFSNIVSKYIFSGSVDNGSWTLRITSGSLVQFRFNHGGTFDILTGTTVLTTNQWYHIAATYDGTTTKLYLNNTVEATSTTYTGAIADSAYCVTIGYEAGTDCLSTPLRRLSGSVDDVRIYKRTLTVQQISALYNSSQPIASWKLDECSGTSILDSTGRSADGTLTVGASGTQSSVGDCSTSSTAWGNGSLGKYSSGMNFDGTDDQINIYSTNLTSAFDTNQGTALAWVKVSGSGVWTDATVRKILHIGADINSNAVALFKGSNNNQLSLRYIAGGTVSYNNIVTSSTDWLHVGLSWNKTADEVKLYFNGTQYGSTLTGLGTWSGSISSTLAAIGVTRTSDAYQPWSGMIDDVRVYNTPLSPNQVAAIYNSGSYMDFGVDTAAPTGTVYDGTSTGVDLSFNTGSLSDLSSNWSITDADSGILRYDYSIGSTQGGTDIKTWTANGTTPSVTASALTLQSSSAYYYNIRTYDNAGNSSIISSNGQYVAPTLTFSISSNSITFSNLNNSNSFTDTKTTTITTSTNAYRGYVVRLYKTDAPRNTVRTTITIPDFSVGSYASPAAWTAGNYGFGYTSSDTSVQGSNKFGNTPCPGGGTPPCYAPFSSTGPGDIVADNTSTISGTPIVNEQFTITYKVQTANTQAAGTYSTVLVYTIVPQY